MLRDRKTILINDYIAELSPVSIVIPLRAVWTLTCRPVRPQISDLTRTVTSGSIP